MCGIELLWDSASPFGSDKQMRAKNLLIRIANCWAALASRLVAYAQQT
jgi:hypothetical protein